MGIKGRAHYPNHGIKYAGIPISLGIDTTMGFYDPEVVGQCSLPKREGRGTKRAAQVGWTPQNDTSMATVTAITTHCLSLQISGFPSMEL